MPGVALNATPTRPAAPWSAATNAVHPMYQPDKFSLCMVAAAPARTTRTGRAMTQRCTTTTPTTRRRTPRASTRGSRAP
eukprot:6531930-Prymnesium_polylepis.1